jgi:HSP20 family protein
VNDWFTLHDSVKWLSQERPYGSYLQQFRLGDGADAERISAGYDNGVLTVTILVERAKPRKIEIASGHGLFKKQPAAVAV